MFCDFHCHYISENQIKKYLEENIFFALSFYNQSDFENFKKSVYFGNSNIRIVIGCHPWFLNLGNLTFVKNQFKNNSVHGIGEIGFDKKCDNFIIQEYYFREQIELAIENNLPVVFHGYKSFDFFKKYLTLLKKLKISIFHGYSGSFSESIYLLKNGVNCKFSFGKNILQENKKAIECIKCLPIENLCLETDFTEKNNISIKEVYNKVYTIRQILTEIDKKSFNKSMLNNFFSIFT